MAITATDTGSELLITTNKIGTDIEVSAAGNTLTLTSTTHEINGNVMVGGVSTATFNLNDFDRITVLPGAVDLNIFNNVNIIGSAAFANEFIYAGGANVDVTGGALSVNGLILSSQQLGAAIDLDQQINSTSSVELHPYSGDVILRAAINAPGQEVSLISGYLQTNTFGVTQTAAGVITAASLYVEAGGSVDLRADNHISRIAGQVAAFGFLVSSPADVPGDFYFNNADDLTVSTVRRIISGPSRGDCSGVTTTNGNITISVAAGKQLTVAAPITANGAGKTLTLAANVFDLDASQGLTAENVVLQTVGAGVNLTLGGAGLTNAELNSINATNLAVQASGTITVSGAIALGDDVSQVVTLKAASVNIANSISGNSSTGVLRFETDSLALNGAISQSVSAPAVEIVTTKDVLFNNTFNFGGMDFTANELAALDEATVNTLRFVTSGNITFADVPTNFNNGFVMKSGGVVALKSDKTISQGAGAAVTAPRLALVGGAVNLTESGNDIQIVAGSAATGDFLLRSSTSLQIDALDVGGRGIGASGLSVPTAGKRADLQSDLHVTQTANGKITASALAVRALGNITLGTAVNSVGTLAMKAGGDSYFEQDLQTLTIGTVGAISGVTSTNPTTATAKIVADGDVIVSQAIQLDGGGQLRTVLLTTGGGNVTQGTDGKIEAAALAVSALGRIELDGAVNNVSTLAMTTSTNFGVYFTNDSGGTLTIGEVGGIVGITSTSSTTLVGIKTADDLVIDKAVQLVGGGQLFHVGVNSLDGSVSQTASGEINSTALTVLAETNITLDLAANDVALVQFHTDAAGAIKFKGDSASLQVASASLRNVGNASGVTSDSAATTVALSNTGDVVVSYFIKKTDGGRLGAVSLTSENGSVSQLYFSPAIPGKVEADSLSVHAQNNITFDQVDNNVLTLAMKTDAAGDIKFRNDSGATLTIGAVGTLSGITSDAAATNVTITTADDLSLTAAIQKSGGGQLAQTLLTSTSGYVTQTASGKIEAAALGVSAVGTILLGTVTSNVSTLAMQAGGGSSYFKNDSGGTLTIGTVAGLSGLTSTSASASFEVATADDLVVGQAIQVVGGGRLSFVGLSSDDGAVSQTASGKIASNFLLAVAETNLTFDLATNAVDAIAMRADGLGAIKFKNDSALLNVSNVSAAFASQSGVTAGNAASTVAISNTGNIRLFNGIHKVGDGQLAAVQLTSADGAVLQLATGKIEAASLGVQAQTNVTLDVATNNVLTLAMDTDAAGAMKFKNDSGGTLTIGVVGSISGITSDSADATVSVVAVDGIAVDASIQTAAAGALASVSLTSNEADIQQQTGTLISGATVALSAATNIALAGRTEVGLGDATIVAGGAFSLTGALGLTIAAADNFSDADVTAASVNLTGGALELNFLDGSATVPNLIGQTTTLITTNQAISGAPTTSFYDAGVFRRSIAPAGAPATVTLDGASAAFGVQVDNNVSLSAAALSLTDSDGPIGGTISEGTYAAGTTVGITASANGSGLTYSLTSNPGDLFAIDPTTGVVTLVGATTLNFSTTSSYTIEVTASDGETSIAQEFTITVTNVAPAAPSDDDEGSNTIVEGAPVGTAVGYTATSSDAGGGTVTYVLTDNGGGRFQINATTGVVTIATAALIDYESNASHMYTIRVAAVDASGLQGDDVEVVINVTDAPPSAPVDVNASPNEMNVSAGVGTTVGITASSSDPNGGTVVYSLTNNAGGRYTIDPSTGVVTVATAGQFTSPVYTITVQATVGGLSTTSDFTINVDLVPIVTVIGTNGKDTINVNYKNGVYTVQVNGVTWAETYAAVRRFEIFGLDADDLIKVYESVTVPAYIDGGAGNDVIASGSGDDVLLGGAGDDTLKGGRGRNVMIGGLGKDILQVATGVSTAADASIMIGDRTDHDADKAALLAISAAWKANGASTDATVRSYFNSATVHGDGLSDTLTSSSSVIDWLFSYELKSNGSRLDALSVQSNDRIN